MESWPYFKDIGVMDYRGSSPDTISQSYEFKSASSSSTARYGPYDFTRGEFHDFTIIWNDQYIQFLVDGKQHGKVFQTWENHKLAGKYFIALELAVGGSTGGTIFQNTPFPQEVVIDYIRVYEDQSAQKNVNQMFLSD